jgi:FAD/FMN-containing dehydrogenase
MILDRTSRLKNFFEFSGVEYSESEQVRHTHARDSSVFSIEPSYIVYPKNAEELGVLILGAQNHGYTVAVRAGGTCMSGGSLTDSVSIDLKKYMSEIAYDASAHIVTAQMGAYFRDIEALIKPHGRMFAAYPSSKDMCGIGGIIGNNASGEKSMRHGATIDNVERLWAVLHDGNEYEFGPVSGESWLQLQAESSPRGDLARTVAKLLFSKMKTIESLAPNVPKCASGYRIDRVYDPKTNTYNLARLFVGSQGTLGIITKAELTTVSIPSYTELLIVSVSDLSLLPKLLSAIIKMSPECVETFDRHTYEYARAFLPDETARVSKYMDDAHLLILVEMSESTSDKTSEAAHDCARVLEALGGRVHSVHDNTLYDSLWAIRRSSFRVMRDGVSLPSAAVPCIEDIIVPIASFDVFVPELMYILESRSILYGYHGHIGDGALRIIPIFNLSDPRAADMIIELSHEVFALVRRMGGCMSADHSDGIIRSPFLNEFYGEELVSIFAQIQNCCDPQHTLNPIKKTRGAFEHINKYIVKV